MRADFESHNGTFLLYPTRRDVWRKQAVPIAKVIAHLASVLAEFEPVTLGVLPEVDRASVGVGPDRVRVVPMEYDDIWIRDTGAIPVGEGLVGFGFNAWGGELYGDWSRDLTVPEQMSSLVSLPLTRCDVTLEGGNLTTDGKGTLICIKDTVVNGNRNPDRSQAQIEDALRRALGVQKLLWLPRGLAFDETGGHVDNLCAFADERTVLLAWTDDPEDPQYPIVREAFSVLDGETTAHGEPLEIVKLPLPRRFVRTADDCDGLLISPESKARLEGEVIQPSYLNFIFANGAVILPAFDDPADAEARHVFEKVFPDRRVIAFPSREIVLGGGGLHCITKNY